MQQPKGVSMGFFDLGLSDILSPVASFLGTQSANDAAAARQESANAFSAQQYATRYQTTVKDLQAAGLSPMLAYSNGPGSAPSSATPAPVQNALGNAVSSYQTSKATSAQTALQQEQVKQAQSQVNLNNASAGKAAAEATEAVKRAELIDAQIGTEKNRPTNVSAQTEAFQAGASSSAAQADYTRKNIEYLTANMDNLRAELKRLQLGNDLTAPEADIAKKYPTYYYLFHKLMPSLGVSMPNVNVINRAK